MGDVPWVFSARLFDRGRVVPASGALITGLWEFGSRHDLMQSWHFDERWEGLACGSSILS